MPSGMPVAINLPGPPAVEGATRILVLDHAVTAEELANDEVGTGVGGARGAA